MSTLSRVLATFYIASALWLLWQTCTLAQGVAMPGLGKPGNLPPPDGNLRLLTQQGEQASRAIPPSAPPKSAPSNGIIQFPARVVTIPAPAGPGGGGISPGEKAPAGPGGGGVSPGEKGYFLPANATPPCPYSEAVQWVNYASLSDYQSNKNPIPVLDKTIGLEKTFPNGVTWHVCVTDTGMKGMGLSRVYLKRTPTSPWMWVLYQAGLADIFVPYDQSTTFRPYDMRWTHMLDQVFNNLAGINGTLITLSNEKVPTVVAEVRERGVGWLCIGKTEEAWRGQEFVVWGVSDGGNYKNIVEYSFRDDGGMTFRLGNTGYNNPAMPTQAHTHNGLWRVDMDLNGAANNRAIWFQHAEPDPDSSPFLQSSNDELPFNGGVEGARRWDASPIPPAPPGLLPQYTSLLIQDAATNAFGNNLGYEFTPLQAGTSRHYGTAFGTEVWTQNDVYVTVYHPNELDWTITDYPASHWKSPDNYLLTSINGESVYPRNDLVVWIDASKVHDPTDEDRSVNDLSGGGTTGVTLVHWSGFNIEPHNLFDINPLGGPVQCDAPLCPLCQ
jgi:primary-amine oxidase